MAKFSEIDRWITEVHNTDGCAVCGSQLGFRSSSNFCSKRCFDLARHVREYCQARLLPYTDLEFRLTFLEGVYPTLALPPVLQPYYPGIAQRIYPVMPQELQSIHQIEHALRPGLIRELGEVVVKEVEFAENLWGKNFMQKRHCFQRGLYTRSFLQSGTFICPDCGGKWFDGQLAHFSGQTACCEKIQMKLPF